MSIAAISSSFVSAVRASAAPASVDPARPVAPARAVQRGNPEGGHRHELVDAMNQVLGVDGTQTKDQSQVVFRFAHALMHDLRSLDVAGASAMAPSTAWGQRDWRDLAQRIDALATAANAPASGPAPDTAAAPAPATPPPLVTSAAAQPSEGPPMPNPITPLSAAVHLMQVPSSHLLEAYAALRKAIGDQSASTGSQRGDLAAFLDQLVHQLAPDAAAPAGSVLHLTA